MTQVRQYLSVLAMAALAGGGCAHGNAAVENAGLMEDDDDRTVVRVTNNNWSDMTVYLLRDGLRRRLGTVTSQTTDTFVVPTYLMTTSGRVHLLADPIGSRNAFASPPIIINPGQRAEWQLENSLALSSFWIR